MIASLAPAASPGLRIFPLHGIVRNGVIACTCSRGPQCTDIGKHPMVSWRTYNENNKGPSGGYGIQTGHFNGIFVIDLDAKPDKNGVNELVKLAGGRPIPDTLSVLTPSGGVHLYFRLPLDVRVPNSRGKLGPGIDVRGEGGYVVGPGSPHKNGGTYQAVPDELADPPAWLLELVVGTPGAPASLETEHRVIDPASDEGVRAVAWTRDYLARAEPAIEGQGGSDRLYAACCYITRSALPLNVLQQLIEEVYNPRCVPPWSTREIEHKITDADRRPDQYPRGLCPPGFIDRLLNRTTATDRREPDPLHEYTFEIGMRGSGDAVKATFGEVSSDLHDHVDWAGVLSFDTFRDHIVAVDPPMRLDAETSSLSDNDVQLVRAWFEFHDKKLNTQDVRAAIETVARKQPFHPVQDMLQALEWDGSRRLDRVLPDCFCTADGAYELAIGPRWFISLVARIMEPGCQSDCTLVLEGDQGIGKTSAFRALMHDPTWYAESSCGVDSKDFFENLRGVWLMGFDELDSLSRASLTRVKTVLTSTRDKYRKSYGHYSEDHPRACGFCGSTNGLQYLNDPTGARRFWPVKVLRPIHVGHIAAARDQLWAEAFARWRAGEPWHVNTPELLALCKDEQEARFEVDSWEELIHRWLNDPAKFSRAAIAHEPGTGSVFKGVRVFDGSKGVTTSDLLEHAIGKLKGQWTTGDAMRVGKIVQQRLGMKRIRVRVGTFLEWRYVFPST